MKIYKLPIMILLVKGFGRSNSFLQTSESIDLNLVI